MSYHQNIKDSIVKESKAEKYQRIKEDAKISLLIAIMLCTYILVAYCFLSPYFLLFLVLLPIYLFFLGAVLFKRLFLVKHKDWLLHWVKNHPKKSYYAINISYILFIFFTMLFVSTVIIAGFSILCFLFMNLPASFIIPVATRYIFLVTFFAGVASICMLTYLPPSHRSVLLGCASIKMKIGKWGSLDLYRFSKIKDVLSETSTGRLILASLPIEEIFVMLETQLHTYNIRSKNLEELADDTIEYVLYPSDSTPLFFNRLKILWNDLWSMQKRFSKNGFNIEEYVKTKRERKTKALARYKEMQSRTEFCVTVITRIGGLIVSAIILYLSLTQYFNF